CQIRNPKSEIRNRNRLLTSAATVVGQQCRLESKTNVAHSNPKLIAIALGDAGGIGPEVTLKAVAAELTSDDTRYVLIGNGGLLIELNGKLKLNLPLAPFRADDAQSRVAWCDSLTRHEDARSPKQGEVRGEGASDTLSPIGGEGWGEGATEHGPGCPAHARAAIACLK